MRPSALLLAVAATLAAPKAGALSVVGDTHEACGSTSNYALKLEPGAIAFTRDTAPRSVRLAAGRLEVDGRELALSAADRDRIAELERRVRLLVPEVKAIALEGIEIAFHALRAVAASFADEAALARTAERLAQWRDALAARIDDLFAERAFDEREFERLIEAAVSEIVPEIAGLAASAAVRATLSGDAARLEAIERRAGELERTIEREVETRARALEARAEALCPQVRALDEIESGLALRVDGAPLDLFRPAN